MGDRMTKITPGARIPVLDFGIIRLETTDNDYEIKVRLKINGRYFTGTLRGTNEPKLPLKKVKLNRFNWWRCELI